MVSLVSFESITANYSWILSRGFFIYSFETMSPEAKLVRRASLDESHACDVVSFEHRSDVSSPDKVARLSHARARLDRIAIRISDHIHSGERSRSWSREISSINFAY